MTERCEIRFDEKIPSPITWVPAKRDMMRIAGFISYADWEL